MLFAVFDHNDATGQPAARQLDQRLELVTAYERLGYYAYQMAEHHGTPLGIATPHLMLAAASRLTSSIRLGMLISILPLVPPLRMVEEAATLDQLSNGRLVLGVGRGVSPVETGFHGVPGDEAQPRFDEAFEILRMGLDPDVAEVTFHGKYYDIDSAPVVTKPVQRPLVPWYATRTPDKARWCARLGLPMLALVPSPQVRTLTDAYREEWAALGRAEADLPPLGISRQIVIADTTGQAQEIAAPRLRPVHRQPQLPVEEVRRPDAARRGLRHLRDDPRRATATRATRPARAPGSPSTPRRRASTTSRSSSRSAT